MATPVGYQQITIAAAAKSLTVPTAGTQRPSYCLITPEVQAVRWRDDGIAPTAAIGMPLAVGAVLRYDADLNKVQFMEQVAGAIINIAYFY